MTELTAPPLDGFDPEAYKRAVAERQERQTQNPLSLTPTRAAANGLSDFDPAVYQRAIDQRQGRRDQRLARNITVALESDPEVVAEAQRIGLEINVDPTQVEQDLDGYRKAYQKVRLERWRRSVDDPILRRQMLDPAFARLAYDDVDQLNLIGQITIGFMRGLYMARGGREAAEIRGDGSLEDWERDGLLRYESNSRMAGALNRFNLGMLGSAAEIVGQVFQTLPDILASGATAAVSAAGTALVLGQLGPQAVLPEELLTVPVAAGVAGFEAGAQFELWYSASQIEGGHFYRDMVLEGIPQETAFWASHAGGSLAGLLELGGVRLLGSAAGIGLAPLRRTLFKEASKVAAQGFTRQSLLGAGAQTAKGWLLGLGGEVATETGQEIVGILAAEAARATEGRPLKASTPEGRAELRDQLGEIIAKTAKGMALLAVPGPVAHFVASSRQISQTQTDAAQFEKLAQALGGSKLKARSPQATGDYIDAVAAGAPSGVVYVKGETLAQAMADTGTSRETLEASLPQVARQLDATAETGGDVTMSLGDYTGHIVGQKLDGALRQHVRFRKDGYSAAELPAVQAAQAAIQQQAEKQLDDTPSFAQEGAALAEAFRVQVVATERVSARVARDTAAVYRAFVETQARRLNISPLEFAKQFETKVVRGEKGETKATTETTEEKTPTTAKQAEEKLVKQDSRGVKVGEAPVTPEGGQAAEAQIEEAQTDEEAALQADQGRAEFNPRTGKITLFEGADLTSVLHELSHGFLHWYGRMATEAAAIAETRQAEGQQGPVPQSQAAVDMEVFLDWRGIEGGVEAWNAMSLEQQRPHHEAFAEGFETYAFEGTAPSLALQRVFSRFRQFITTLWRNLRGESQQISPEMRQVFDRMLASQDAIEHADSVRSLEFAFEEKPDNISDEQWETIKQRQDDTREEAIAQVEKRSLRDLQWLRNASSKLLKRMQRDHKQLRSQVRAAIEADTLLEPAYRAMRFLKRGELTNDRGTGLPFEGSHKLNTADVKATLPPGVSIAELRITSPEGLDPGVVAQMFGFPSGQEMVRTLDELRPIGEVIDERTDSKMLREYGDMSDANIVQRVVDESLHNESRARSVATELKAWSGSIQPTRVWVAAARELARRVLDKTPIAEIKASRYRAAEARALREKLSASKKGDVGAAIDAMRAQLLQTQLAREAATVERELERTGRKLRWFSKPETASIRKRYNLDFIKIAQAILATHGFSGDAANPETHLAEVRKYAPQIADDLDAVVQAVASDNTPYQNMPLEDFRQMAEVVNGLKEQARRDMQIQIDGEMQTKQSIVDTLLSIFGDPPEDASPRTLMPKGEKRKRSFGNLLASMRHVESWVLKRDKGIVGSVHKYLFDILRTPFTNYQTEKRALVEPLDALLKKLDFKRGMEIGVVKELKGFVVRDKQMLLGMLLHAGNESNLRKMLLGYEMTERPLEKGGEINTAGWWDFVDRMIEDGWLTEEDFVFVQSVWDTYEQIHPRAQEIHKQLYGHRADTIAPQALNTRLGQFKGGYFPATVDYNEARWRAERANPESAAQLAAAVTELREKDISVDTPAEFRYAMSAGRGFMVERTEVYLPLVLKVDLAAFALDNQLRFIHMQMPARDLMRLLNDEKLGAAIDREDPNAREYIFKPFVQDTVRNRLMQASQHHDVDTFLTLLRRYVGLSVMFANPVVAAQQITGLASAAVYTPWAFLGGATTNYMRLQANPATRGDIFKQVTEKSADMKLRLETHVGQITDDIELMDPTWFERVLGPTIGRGGRKLSELTARYGFFAQRFVQIPVDIITWTGTYDYAISQDMSEADAVRQADTIVRRSQGSGLAPDVSSLERGRAFTRLLLQFQTFWFASLNTVSSNPTVKAYAHIVGLVGMSGAAISMAMRGGWEDDDGDGELWDDVSKWLIGETARSAASLVPGASNILNVATGDYGGRLNMGAFVGQIEKTIGGLTLPFRAPFKETPVTGFDVRSLGVMFTLLTGIPITPITQRIAVGVDEAQGKVNEGNLDFPGRSFITGR